jgi:2TM family of unknown function (DUF5676)
MLNWRVVTLTLGVFGSVMFLSCVVYGLAVPAVWHPAWALEAVLPGFHWLTPASVVLGAVETFLYGAYAGIVYSALYNLFARRLEATRGAALTRPRAA